MSLDKKELSLPADIESLNQRLRAFCDLLSRENYSGEGDELIHAMWQYRELSPAEMYANMIQAQSSLFFGNPESVRRGIDIELPDSDDMEKAEFIASSIRDSIMQTIYTLPDDPVLKRIYTTVVVYEENDNHVWECLFAAAVYYNSTMLPNPLPPYASVRHTFMAALASPERDLYGDFDPTPIAEPDGDTSVPASTRNPPKFIH